MDMPISGLAKALTETNKTTKDQAYRYQQQALIQQVALARYLYDHKLVTENDISEACADYFGLSTINITAIKKYTNHPNSIQFNYKNKICNAVIDPCELININNKNDTYLIKMSDFITLQQHHKKNNKAESNTLHELKQIISTAIIKSASDIHIEPSNQNYQIRLRINGQLRLIHQLDLTQGQRLITQLLVQAHCDITQNNLAQDGRFEWNSDKQTCDCRLSSCPTIHGTKIVIRILNTKNNSLQIDRLGMLEKQQKLLTDTLKQHQGLILVTGPTGSGKTQTLYSIIQYLSQQEINISTIEDPVEIKLAGINQIAVNTKIGFSTEHILRSLLRQDPDVIMVGEIRDQATAALAIHAAQTGHLVLATVHAQSTLSTINRLSHLGIQPHDVSTSLRLVINQRLVATNNQHVSRHAIFEILKITPQLSNAIENKVSNQELHKLLTKDIYISLQQHGDQLIKNNKVTKQQLERVIHSYE